jgi:hypothetical protein
MSWYVLYTRTAMGNKHLQPHRIKGTNSPATSSTKELYPHFAISQNGQGQKQLKTELAGILSS